MVKLGTNCINSVVPCQYIYEITPKSCPLWYNVRGFLIKLF